MPEEYSLDSNASMEFYKTILQTAMDGFWMVDTWGYLLQVNPAYCRMSGYSEAELLTMCVSDLEAHETPDEVAEHARRGAVQGQDRFETRHRRKDGSLFEVEVSFRFLPVQDGRFVAFLRDITERKRAEEQQRASLQEKDAMLAELAQARQALQEAYDKLEGRVQERTAELAFANAALQTENAMRIQAEEKYRSIFENTAEGIFQTSPDGKIITANPAMARILGYQSVKEMRAEDTLNAEMFYPDPGMRTEFVRQLQTKDILQGFVSQFRRRDGKLIWGAENAHTVRDADGKLLYYEGTLEDITRQKEIEQAVEEGRQREAVLNAILRISLEEIPLEEQLSRSLAEILSPRGVSQEKRGCILLADPEKGTLEPCAQQGFPISHMITCACIPDEKCICRQAAQSGKLRFTATLDEQHETWRDGVGPFGGYAVPIQAGGKVMGMLVLYVAAGSQQDARQVKFLQAVAHALSGIIERKRARDAMQKAHDELELRVDLRTNQLQTAAAVSKFASTLLNPDQLMSRTIDLIVERFGLYAGGIFLLDEMREFAVLHAGSGEAGRRMLADGYRLPLDDTSMIGWCIRHSQARIALRKDDEIACFAGSDLPETCSELVLPLFSRERCIGALSVQSARLSAFTEQDIVVLQSMADQVAIAIDNARLYSAAQAEIAERLEAEAALRSSEARFRALLELAPDAILLVDEAGSIVLVNEQLERAFGHCRDELLGQSVEILLPENLRQLHFQHRIDYARQAAIRPMGRNLNIYALRKDGSQFPADIKLGPLEVDGKQWVIAVVRDISERVWMEERLTWEANANARLAEISRSVITMDTMSEVANLILERGKMLTGSTIGFIGYMDKTGEAIVFPSSANYPRDENLSPDKNQYAELLSVLWGWMLENRQILVANQGAYDPRLAGMHPGDVLLKHIVSAPALIGDDLVGLVVLANPPADYDEGSLVLIEQLASLLALAMQQQRARQALQHYADEQAALYAVTSAASIFLTPDELLPIVLDRVMSIPVIDANAGWILLAGAELGNPLTLGAARNLPQEFLEAETSLSLYGCQYCTNLLDGQEFHTPLLSLHECQHISQDILSKSGIICHISVPISVGHRIMGLINLGWHHMHFYTEAQHKLLMAVGRQVGLALRNTQLYQAALKLDRIQLVNAIGVAASSSLELEVVLRQVLEMTCQALGATEASVLMREVDTDKLVFVQTLQKSSECLHGTYLPAGQGIAGRAAQQASVVCVNDVNQDDHWYDAMDKITGLTTRSVLCAPLIYRERVIGVLEILNSQRGGFTQEDINLVEAIASITASAMENARLFSATRARANELELLNEIGLALTCTLDYISIVDEALFKVQHLFQADSVSMLRPDPQSGELIFVRTLIGSQFVDISTRIPEGHGFVGWAFTRRETLRIDDVLQYPPHMVPFNVTDHQDDVQTRSIMVVPLVIADRAIGVLRVASNNPMAFTGADLHFLQSLASTLAVALDNARLYEDLKHLLVEHQHAQAQLVQSEKISALGRLAASIAHEISNPLQAVQGCLTLLGEEMKNQQRQQKMERYQEIVETEIDRIAAIVHRMRDFYRPARPGLFPTNVTQVLDSVLQLTAKQLQHSNVTLVQNWDHNIPMIQANPDHLKQVFLNIVINAVDAMPEGGILSVSTTQDELALLANQQPAKMIRIEFSDTGLGMGAETISSLFEPFFTTKDYGSGLGLYVSYGIIQSLNGTIQVSSELGRGTTFTILLPIGQI